MDRWQFDIAQPNTIDKTSHTEKHIPDAPFNAIIFPSVLVISSK